MKKSPPPRKPKADDEEEEKKAPPPAPAPAKRKGVLKPSTNYPEAENFSIRNTVCGQWTFVRKTDLIKVPKQAETCSEIIKRTYLRDKLVKDYFERFDLGPD